LTQKYTNVADLIKENAPNDMKKFSIVSR